MTDDLNMQALSGTLGQRAGRSMAAGCDIALHCKGVMAEMQEVAAAAGDMTPAARHRAAAALARRVPDPDLDIARWQADLDALLPGLPHA